MLSQKSRVLLGLVTLSVGSMSTGCASLISGSSQVVSLSSSPPGATVDVVSKKGKVIYSGTTPAMVSLKRGRGYFAGADLKLRVSKDGYDPRELPIKNSLNPWYLGNIVFGGLIGLLVVDPLTGAMFALPDSVHADLDNFVGEASAGAPIRETPPGVDGLNQSSAGAHALSEAQPH